MTWEEYFNHLMEKQMPPAAEHISSMLQDLESRKRTEVDYINGAIVRLGKFHGIKTPERGFSQFDQVFGKNVWGAFS
ncbi:MAG: ketopantoate reductase C-terminal domain-containing protein [Nitrososphaerales archaeon]